MLQFSPVPQPGEAAVKNLFEREAVEEIIFRIDKFRTPDMCRR